jgi:uncharacterized protein YkwD
MARRTTLLALALVALIVAIVTAPAGGASSPEATMLAKVNNYRRAHGVKPVHLSNSLKSSADRKAHDMLRSQRFGHDSRIHANHHYRRLGEIIEMQTGYAPDVNRAFKAWIHSSPHRAIILDRGFNYAGAGRAAGRYHGRKTTMWVMHYGHP